MEEHSLDYSSGKSLELSWNKGLLPEASALKCGARRPTSLLFNDQICKLGCLNTSKQLGSLSSWAYTKPILQPLSRSFGIRRESFVRSPQVASRGYDGVNFTASAQASLAG
jgi:hypothetical protein